MVTKQQLLNIKSKLINTYTEKKENCKKQLINKLNKVAKRQRKTQWLYYEDKLADLQVSLELEERENHQEVLKTMISVLESADKEKYNQAVKKHNQGVVNDE